MTGARQTNFVRSVFTSSLEITLRILARDRSSRAPQSRTVPSTMALRTARSHECCSVSGIGSARAKACSRLADFDRSHPAHDSPLTLFRTHFPARPDEPASACRKRRLCPRPQASPTPSEISAGTLTASNKELAPAEDRKDEPPIRSASLDAPWRLTPRRPSPSPRSQGSEDHRSRRPPPLHGLSYDPLIQVRPSRENSLVRIYSSWRAGSPFRQVIGPTWTNTPAATSIRI